jgi:hypothetical protein
MQMKFGAGIRLLAGLNDQPEPSKEYSFTLSGDLNQMVEQMDHLFKMGLDVQRKNIYPVIKGSDKKVALQLIYKNRINGWWLYKKEYIKLGICTGDEFNHELHAQCERNKNL